VNLKLRCMFDLSHLHEVNKLAGSRHGHGLDVGGDVAQDGQQAVEEGLQPVVSASDNLLKGRKTLNLFFISHTDGFATHIGRSSHFAL
jgi:hypothetical protein